MATKEQERKALEQIRKIVEGLGEDSYIGTAFEGCFEIAASNIENDWACSMKQRVDSLAEELDRSNNKAAELKKQLDWACATMDKNFNAAEAKARSLEDQLVAARSRQLTTELKLSIRCFMADRAEMARKVMMKAAETLANFADHPADIAFQNAAKLLREQKAIADEADAIIARLDKIPT